MRTLRLERYLRWAVLGVLLFLGTWGLHTHLENAWKCPLCAQSLVESGPPAGLDVSLVCRPLAPPDVQAPVPCALIPPFSPRAPPVG